MKKPEALTAIGVALETRQMIREYCDENGLKIYRIVHKAIEEYIERHKQQ